MGQLEQIRTPRDLRDLGDEQLDALAAEIRDLLVGDLRPHRRAPRPQPRRGRADPRPAPGLRLARATASLRHRPPGLRAQDPHRPGADFDRLRQEGGLSGYPSQAESEHDIVENSHASTALSYADGLAKAYALRGDDRHVVAVVGDGALTGGMCWEALNNIAAARSSRLVIVVNDNGRSYAPTIGGLANRSPRCGSTRATSRCSTWSRTPPRCRASAARVRGAARGQEGHQGRGRAAGALRGPRPQVRRAGRRARPRRGGERAARPSASAAR